MPTPLLELKGIGKIYVSEGNVTVGIRGVNLSFDKGEFVAITGASGSGKSTLLNLLSGMDSYEEGELLIEGEPTSHYLQKDWEEYRKQYISFIFQEYNIIESFTVLENVELALMNIPDRRERRARALELLRRVGLEKFIHHKGSKLSGGQKQRTVIARALAKDSPIILADEPTGNLDSKTSEEIVSLLREVSQDKLVIMVTHNFDQVEHCATRHIRIFDGAVESDQTLVAPAPLTETRLQTVQPSAPPKSTRRQTLSNGLSLGRVRFRAMPKLSIFLCLLMTLTSLALCFYSATSVDTDGLFDPSYMFHHVKGRTVITRADGGIISEEELEALAERVGADSSVLYDYMIDQTTSCWPAGTNETAQTCRYGLAKGLSVDGGRLPETAGEVVLEIPIQYKELLGSGKDFQPYTLYGDWRGDVNYTVTGVRYFYDNTRDSRMLFTAEGYRIAAAVTFFSRQNNFSGNVTLQYTDEEGVPCQVSVDLWTGDILCDVTLAPGTYTLASLCAPDAEETYRDPSVEVTLTGTFTSYRHNRDFHNENSFGYSEGSVVIEEVISSPSYGQQGTVSMDFADYTLGLGGTEQTRRIAEEHGYGHTLILSPDILSTFVEETYFAQAYTQASLFFDSDKTAEGKVEELRELGYIAVPSTETVEPDFMTRLSKLVGIVFLVLGWVLSTVFIALFLGLCTSHAMNATRGDIGILRSMGIPTGVVRVSIYVQILIALIPAVLVTAVTCTVIYLVPTTNGLFGFLHAREYIIVAVILVAVALRLAHRHVHKMFDQSVKKTLKGGNKA